MIKRSQDRRRREIMSPKFTEHTIYQLTNDHLWVYVFKFRSQNHSPSPRLDQANPERPLL